MNENITDLENLIWIFFAKEYILLHNIILNERKSKDSDLLKTRKTFFYTDHEDSGLVCDCFIYTYVG